MNSKDSLQIQPSKVTYKHLLERHSHTPKNPLRCIAHCDIDSAYAQFQAVRLGLPPEAPVACNQWDHLLAVNYAARSLGVKPFMRIWEAKAVCPELVCPHVATYKIGESEAKFHDDAHASTHKVSLEPFRRESRKIMNVFSQFCPEVEKASIDEAYLDLTETVRLKILENNPHLRTLPKGASLSDAPPNPPVFVWKDLELAVPVIPPQEAESKQETLSVEAKHALRWRAYALHLTSEIMYECRNEVREQLGYTCSAGIASTKFLAKICSSHRKPNGQTVLLDEAISHFLQPLVIKKVPSLKRKFGQEVADTFKAETLGDLWTFDIGDFQTKLGEKQGFWLYNAIRGKDVGEVNVRLHTKSMTSRKDFLPPLRTIEEIDKALQIVAVDLFARLTEARSESSSIWPKTLVFGARLENDYRSPSYHHQAPISFSAHQLSVETICTQARVLARGFFASLAQSTSSSSSTLGTITNVSLGFQGLEAAQMGQQGIQSFLGKGGDAAGRNSLETSPRKAKVKQGTAFGRSKNAVIDLTGHDDVITVLSSDSDS